MVPVNYWAVLLAALAPMVIGMFWYSPVLFGIQWMKMMGITEKRAAEMKEKMGLTYFYMFLGCIVTAFVLANILGLLGVQTIGMGVMVGFWMWLGFVAPTFLGGYLFSVEKKPVELFLLDSGYQLVNLMVQGAIIVYF